MPQTSFKQPGFIAIDFKPQPRANELCFSFELLGQRQREFPLFTLQVPNAHGNCAYVIAVPDALSSRFCVVACQRDGNVPRYGAALVDDILLLEAQLQAFGVSRGSMESWNRRYPQSGLPLETVETAHIFESIMQRITHGPS